MPDELFWRLAPPELERAFEKYSNRIYAREYAAARRAAMICVTVANSRREKGQRRARMTDFVRDSRHAGSGAPDGEARERLRRRMKTMGPRPSIRD